MRLFELHSTGDGRAILSVIQGLANRPGKEIPSELPFNAFKNLIKGDEVGIGTPDALVAFKNKEDPAGDVISDIKDDGNGNFTVVLNTKKKKDQPQASAQTKAGGPSVDAMAASNAKTISPNL